MEEIGGFLDIELSTGSEYHKNSIKLNCGRNAFRYIIEIKKPKTIYLPYYICKSIIETLNCTKTRFKYYHIDENFQPIINFEIGIDEYLFYVNYFGINQNVAAGLTSRYRNLIIDNCQAFYDKPFRSADTFYSARKFFGVPDGAYLYSNKKLKGVIEQDYSYERFMHLLKRNDVNAESAYSNYLKNERRFSSMPVKTMSKLTESFLKSINYNEIRHKRRRNFFFLHKYLKKYNELKINLAKINCPMVYPLLADKKGLRDFLINNKIYIPTYWKEVMEKVNKKSTEALFVKYLVPLPIDQRYGQKHMEYMIKKIMEY